MDYGKLPLAKRTRRQEELFFQQYYEEKKRKTAAEKQKESGSSAGDPSSMDGNSGQSAAVEAAGSSDVVESVSDSSSSSSEEESEGSSDEDYLIGSGDRLHVGSEDDDEAGVSGVRRVGGKARRQPGKVGLTRRRREKSPEVVYLGQSGRDGERQGEGDDEAAVCKCNGKGKERVSGSGSVDGMRKGEIPPEVGRTRRRRREKSPEVVYLGQSCRDGEREDESGGGPRRVAERLRSRQRHGEEKKELGSFSNPFTLTDEDEEFESSTPSSSSSSGEEDDEDNSLKSSSSGEKRRGNVVTGKRRRDHGNSAAPMSVDAKTVGKSQEKPEGKVERPAKRMKPILVGKILADSILQKSDVLAELLVSSNVPDMESTLPLKFRFLDEVPITPEKSPSEIEADKLFAEMEFALAACAIGDSDSSMIDNEDRFAEETESDRATSCCQQKHHLIIDEQIGVKCIFCSFVATEIKDLLPSFCKHPLGRSDKNYWNSRDHFNFDKLQSQDSASTSNSKDHNCAEGTVWDLIPPGFKTSMFNHQKEAYEFIWKSIGGSIYLEELKKSACDGGSGCIISHAPGTGKTRLAIVFLQAFMELNPECMPVIVAPRGMLQTWEEEFKKWFDIPFHNLSRLEVTGREDKAALNLLNKAGGRGNNVSLNRLVKLHSWTMGKSALGISYRLFEKLAEDGIVAANDEGVSKTKRRSKPYAEPEKVRKMLLEFPKLLILDEGHTPRNDQSLMWRVLSGVQTQRRILLSGTPFQNNFDELFNTLSLVRPTFYDKIVNGRKGDSRRNRGREGRKGRGKWASLTNSIEKDAGNKLNELRAIIDPFVHVHKGEILEMLPGLKEAIIVLKPTDLQKSLIEVIQGRNIFKRDHLASLISVHPSLLLEHALSDEEGLSVDTDKLEMLRFDHKAGVKTNFLMELIRLSMAAKEKVLVFSQFIKPLTFIKEQLKSSFGWTEGKELLYMDGQIEARHRQSSISLLNDPDSQVQVLLASTRACSEGISLVGASRVVLLDVAWNPSKEKQAVSRAYRIGQKKFVYTYRLIMSGAMEVEKRARQIQKDRLSELVFSSADGKLQGEEESISCAVNDDKILEEMIQHEKISYIFEKVLDQPKESSLVHTFG